MTTEQLKSLQQNLAWQLQELEIAKDTAEREEAEYQTKLSRFHAEHIELIARREEAQERRAEVESKVKELRQQASTLLTSDEAIDDLPDGFKQIRIKSIDDQGYISTFDLAQTAPMLLKLKKQPDKYLAEYCKMVREYSHLFEVDEDALLRLVNAVAVEDKKTGEISLPDYVKARCCLMSRSQLRTRQISATKRCSSTRRKNNRNQSSRQMVKICRNRQKKT